MMLHKKGNIRQWVTPLLLILCTHIAAQDAAEEIKAVPQRSAGIRYSLPTGVPQTDTPAPDGKKPFYISHYGCSAAYYLENAKDYEGPINTLATADSLNMLTPLGKDVLSKLRMVYEDAKFRASELTAKGAQQMRLLTQEMVERFPCLFTPGSIVDARSVVRNHNILSMQEAMIQIARSCSPMSLRIKASHSNDVWMHVRDKELEADRFNGETEACYQAFRKANINDQRLMKSLFVSADYVKGHIDPAILSDQLFVVIGTIQSTPLEELVALYNIFTPQELYQLWRIHNARNFICYGRFAQNGGYQAYAQRAPLWNLLHMGDSIKNLDVPVTHLRYTSRSMMLSLVSLMELNTMQQGSLLSEDGFGLRTDDLDQIDKQGWIDYKIAPFGGSLLVVHYRKDKDDEDILIKVLLNGKEMLLPIPSDCAPYYHWDDAKRYYLRKLYAYEKLRYDSKNPPSK